MNSEIRQELTSWVHLDIHLTRVGWRPTAIWAALIGSLLALPLELWPSRWPLVLALLILVDPIWGAWWHWATHRPGEVRREGETRLPYERSRSPRRYLHTLFSEGFVSGMIITGGLALWIGNTLGPAALWMTGAALSLSGITWWLSYVSPAAVRWLRPVYGIGLPLWTAGYVFGRATSLLAAAALILTALFWLRYIRHP